MTRRQALALLLVAVVLAGGRVVRHALLVGDDGSWRQSLWLDRYLPQPPVPPDDDSSRRELTGPLAINRCSADSLEMLPGIGPVLAGRIVADRAVSGPYADCDDLQRVKGIGPRMAARLAPHLVFSDTNARAGSEVLGESGAADGPLPPDKAANRPSSPQKYRR
jgi:hypothetical protein